jgi:hypothetical protein
MPSLSYQEKSLYGTLAADLIVYVPYFVYLIKSGVPPALPGRQ